MGLHKFRPSIALAWLLVTSACAADEQPEPNVTWEQFEQRSARLVEGRTVYIIEGDLPVTREQLRLYYDQVVRRASMIDDTATTGSALAVNLFNGGVDIWTPAERFNLRYCVSNTFGALHTRAAQEMLDAVNAWEGVADVDFHYIPAENGSCTNANPNVTFAVEPWSSGGACSFFPSGLSCIPRTIVIDYNDFDTNPIWQQLAPNITTTGVLIHEVGHALGWRHEHTRDPFGCFEDNDWLGLTVYDPGSTMHYPWCPGGIMTATLQLTVRDGEGAANAYGWFTNMNSLDRRVEPAPQGDYFNSAVGQSFTAPFDVTIRHIDTCSWQGSGPTVMQIRAGDNINGALIASTTNIVRTNEECGWGGSGYTWFRATFSPDVTLSAGAHTARFNNATYVGVVYNYSNPYSGGAIWDDYLGGRRDATSDAVIRVVRPAP